MNRHRDDVRQAVDDLHLPVVAALSLQVVQELRSRQVQSVEIKPGVSGHSTATPTVFDRDVKEAVRQLVRDRGIEDLEEVDVVFTLRQSTRTVRCVVAGTLSNSRELEVVTLAGRSRIRTRWVHMWHDWKHTQEWPEGWDAALAG
jgi:hypothetical protein